MTPFNARSRGGSRVQVVACALGGLLALLGCDKCSGEPQAAETRGIERTAPYDPASGSIIHHGDVNENPLALLDVESLRASQVLVYGEIDTTNRYSSVVLVKPRKESPKRISDRTECSGVLIAPRLILTAGPCVCESPEEGLSRGGDDLTADAAECPHEAVVTTIVHTPSEEVPGESIVAMKIYKGEVRHHPSMQLASDTTRNSVSSLAVVLLERPLMDEIQPVPLSNAEVQGGETLTVVGYGYDEVIGGKHGTRRFTTMTVEKPAGALTGRIKLDQPGLRLYPNDSGGPCLREDATGTGLIGVVGIISDKESSFTSIHGFRDWLRAEILHANN